MGSYIMVGKFATMTAAEMLEEIKETTVKAGGMMFQYCPSGGGENRPYKVTISRWGYGYCTEAEIISALGGGPFQCEIMR